MADDNLADVNSIVDSMMAVPRQNAIGAANDNPDHAAEAVSLSQNTGVPAQSIYSDLDNFKTMLKQHASAAIVQGNPHLQDYVSDPMNARVSNDDLDQLDKVSGHATELAQPGIWNRITSHFSRAKDAFAENFDWEGQQQEKADLYNYVDSDAWRGFMSGFGGMAATGFNAAMHLPGAAIAAGSAEVGSLYGAATGADIYQQRKLERDLNVFGQVAMGAESGVLHAPEQLNQIASAASRSRDIAKPFLEAGKPPPVGVDPIIDAAHLAENQSDLATLKEALKESVASATRERSPGSFVQFVRQHTGERTLGIDHDAVRELYGSGVPEPGDGKLGFVDDLPSQLLRSSVTGGDINVRYADWLTHVDPALQTQLEPHIRTRPGGITQFEADALAQEYEKKPTLISAFHGTNREFDQFDSSAPSTSAERSLSEEGASFHTTDREAASIYGSRVLRSEIVLGNTSEFDARDLFLNDQDFAARTLASGVDEQTFKKAQDDYRANEGRQRPVFEKAGVEYVREGVPPSLNSRNVIMQMARERGLDTAGIKGLGDTGGNYDQIAVLNPKNVRFPDLTNPVDKAAEVLAQQAGLIRARLSEEPLRPYLFDPNNPNYHFNDGSGKILLKAEEGPQGWVGHYADVGEASPTVDVLQDLKKIVGPTSDKMLETSADVMSHVLQHIGAAEVPTYTVRPQNPAVRQMLGAYYPSSDAMVLRHTGDDAQMLGTAVHEAAHVAFQRVLANDKAAFNIVDAMRKEFGAQADVDRHGRPHYGLTNPHEFISEAFRGGSKFQRELAKVKPSDELRAQLDTYLGETPRSKISNLWDAFLVFARKAFGMPLTDESLSLLDYTMKIGDRLTGLAKGMDETARTQFDQQVHAMPDETGAFDRAAQLGMSQTQFQKLQKLLTDQTKSEVEARIARIHAEEQRRQGKEWKENEKAVSQEMVKAVRERPDVLGDTVLREGMRLNTYSLTPEQQEMLKGYHTRDGVEPRQLADQLGFASVQDMVQKIGDLQKARGEIRNIDFQRALIKEATAAEMERRYGKLGQNVVDAAKDRVLSDTQLQILYEEAQAGGVKLPVTLDQMKDNVARVVGDTKMSDVDSNAALNAAGKVGRPIMNAAVDDPKELVKARLRQINHLATAKEFTRIEKLKVQFDRMAKTYGKQTVTGAEQEYVDRLHSVMQRLGLKVSRNQAELEASLRDKSFGDWVREKEGDLGKRDLFVPEFLMDEKFAGTVDGLTADQFEETHKFFKAMIHNARDENKIIRAGESADFKATMAEIVDRIKSLGPAKDYSARGARDKFSVRNVANRFAWAHIVLESMLDRIDRGDWNGVLNQTIRAQYSDAANYREKLLRDFGKRWHNDIGKIADFNKEVENPLFRDKNGRLIRMTKENLLGVLQNVGNSDNLRVLSQGYKVHPQAILDWLHRNTTKEDWDRAQKIGDMFDELHDMADTMSRSLNGVGVDKVPLREFDTPFGTYKGWYNPLAYDQYMLGDSKKILLSGADTDGYFRSTRIAPPKTYTKARTGYVGPLQLDLSIAPLRMHQMIHDIATRPAVQQLNKIFGDKNFRQAMIDHYGKAQDDALIPFLRDFAQSGTMDSEAAVVGRGVMNFLSGNAVSTLVGLNPRTMLKHSSTAALKSVIETGPVGFMQELVGLGRKTLDPNQTNWSYAVGKSEELQRRMTNWSELIEQHGQEIGFRGGGSRFQDWRRFAQWAGTLPIATTDMMSSVPTWLARYKEEVAKGSDEGTAVDLADKAVRKTHGSSISTNKPEIARTTNPFQKAYASLYGFFSENLQNQYELAWRSADSLGYMKQGEWDKFREQLPKIASKAVTAVLMPALIEELVTPQTNDKHESWGKWAGTVLFHGMTSGWIGLRDLALGSNFDPSSGTIGTMAKQLHQSSKTMSDIASGKVISSERMGKLIQDAFTTTGFLTGYTNAEEGRLLQYLYRYNKGLEHPKNVWQAIVDGSKGRHPKER